MLGALQVLTCVVGAAALICGSGLAAVVGAHRLRGRSRRRKLLEGPGGFTWEPATTPDADRELVLAMLSQLEEIERLPTVSDRRV